MGPGTFFAGRRSCAAVFRRRRGGGRSSAVDTPQPLD